MSHPLVLPHEDTIRKQVLETHNPEDGRRNIINVGRILDVVHNIILNTHTAAAAGTTTLEQQLRQPLDYDNIQLLFKIQQLSCQVGSEWSGDVGLYVMTINLLRMLSSYEWEAKAVMLLAAFANNHGDQCIFTHQTRRLAKKVWLLKQSTAPHPNDTTTFDDRQRTIVGSINSILNLTKRMLELKQLPQQFIPLSLDSDILSSTVYHITQAVLVCASLLKTLGVARSQIPAGVVESLAHYKKEFEDTDITLQALLNDCHTKIEEKEVQESYEALKLAFSRSDRSDDNRDILKLLFNVKDDQNMPLYHGETKVEAELDVLPTDKNLLLVISSGLDISKERAEYLGKVYKDCQQNHGMIWIPVVNGRRREFWNEEKVNEFESLLAVMGFYSVKDPRKSVAAGLHKYVEEDLFQGVEKDDFFRIGKEPIVVVLDYKGKFVHKNAMGMILAWGADASPFDTYKEECMWRDETWGTALMTTTIHPIRQWMNAKPQGANKECLFFLYGGNDIEWVRQFKIEVEKSVSSDYEPRMMYLGRNKEVRSIISPSDCLDEPSTWLFYTRLQTTLLSRMNYLSKFNLNKLGHDNILSLLKKLLAYKSLGETGGWCLLCTKDVVIRCTNEATMLRLLTEYKDRKEVIAKDNNKHFYEVFEVQYDHPKYSSNSFTSLYHQPCCELEYPSELGYPTTFTEIPEREMCPVCYTYMYKLITFACCHGHAHHDLEYDENDDATNK
ncbi:PREDICTED: protein SIEVE ELEMENT OCCLUSION B-like [Ipomoea nil]|uniref:protein SIEVE ELEMENT OCCLUSION B-like n=1 Tax=Ipomoea nil TaxID=35883 RepID=UPI0009014A93|nr:PREDICTED: protein SIEVE ELEMENT OCCLUSION B-like [Ipomoea nil]